MGEKAKIWLSFIGPAIALILFIALWFGVTPMRDLTAQVNDHERRICVQENAGETIESRLQRVEEKLDKIMEIMMGGQK